MEEDQDNEEGEHGCGQRQTREEQQSRSAKIVMQGQGGHEEIHQLQLIDGSKAREVGGTTSVPHSEWVCPLFGRLPKQCEKPIPDEDREEFALGVALVHYLMNAGIKIESKGQSRSDQGAHSNSRHEHVLPNQGGNPDLLQKEESALVAHVPQEEKGQFSEVAYMRQQRAQAEGRHLVETRDYIAHGGNEIGAYH